MGDSASRCALGSSSSPTLCMSCEMLVNCARTEATGASGAIQYAEDMRKCYV